MFRTTLKSALAYAIVAWLGLASAPVFLGAPPDEATQKLLIDLEKQSWQAWKNHDAKFFQNFLSDDHIEMMSHGPANRATVLRVVGDAICTVGEYSVDRFRVDLIDVNTALITYHAAQQTTCQGEPVPSPVWATSIYVKRNGKWLNFFYEHTPAAE